MATSMFTTKMFSSNACPMTATRPMATTIERIAITSGIAAPTSVPKTSDEHDQRRRKPELHLALLQVGLGDLREVVVDRVLARDVHREPVRAVRPLDRGDHVIDRRRLRLVGHHDRQQRRVAVARDEDRAAAVQVGRDAAHVGLAAKLVGQPLDLRGVRGVADRELIGAHDHELVERVRAGQPLVDEILRAQRLGLRRDAAVVVSALDSNPLVNAMPRSANSAQIGEHALRVGGGVARQPARTEPSVVQFAGFTATSACSWLPSLTALELRGRRAAPERGEPNSLRPRSATYR